MVFWSLLSIICHLVPVVRSMSSDFCGLLSAVWSISTGLHQFVWSLLSGIRKSSVCLIFICCLISTILSRSFLLNHLISVTVCWRWSSGHCRLAFVYLVSVLWFLSPGFSRMFIYLFIYTNTFIPTRLCCLAPVVWSLSSEFCHFVSVSVVWSRTYNFVCLVSFDFSSCFVRSVLKFLSLFSILVVLFICVYFQMSLEIIYHQK